jgi:hypothetical protein
MAGPSELTEQAKTSQTKRSAQQQGKEYQKNRGKSQ